MTISKSSYAASQGIPGSCREWVYSRLAGIRPTADGFAEVKIAPHISKDYGPAAVSCSLQTPRGVISSNWTRAEPRPASTSSGAVSAEFVRVSVEVPLLSAVAEVVLPLLGRAAGGVRVSMGGTIWPTIWDGGQVASSVTVTAAAAVDGAEELRVRLGPGRWTFVVGERGPLPRS